MTHRVNWLGSPTELAGPKLAKGDRAPSAFSLVGVEMDALRGEDLAGKSRILVAAPSLDTPVCDVQARRWNQEAVTIPGVFVLVVTVDLPFALKRWCGAAGVERLRTYSDHRDRSFGAAYGALAPALGLLARAVFVIDPDDVIQHVEYVPEVGDEPDYQAALEAARALG